MTPEEEVMRLAHRVRQQRAVKRWAYPPAILFCVFGIAWGFWKAFDYLEGMGQEPQAEQLDAAALRGMAVFDALAFLGPIFLALICLLTLILLLVKILFPRTDLDLMIKMAELHMNQPSSEG